MNKLTRSALIATGTVGSALALVGPASAATSTALSTTPPDPTTVIPQMGGALSNGVVDGFVTLLPLAIPVLVIFTVWAFAKRLVGAKKGAR